jgi:hypothetical protein
MTATTDTGFIYTSSDAGVTWVARDSSRSWYGVAVSSKALIQTAVSADGIYRSVDSGSTWTQADTAVARYITMSSDAVHQAATDGSSSWWSSADSGATWTAEGPETFNLGNITYNGSGSVLIVSSGTADTMQKSTDYGATWTQVGTETGGNWYSLDSSGSGSEVLAARTDADAGIPGVSAARLWESQDFGDTWAVRSDSPTMTTTHIWGPVAVSNVQRMTAGVLGGRPWISVTPNPDITSCHISFLQPYDGGPTCFLANGNSFGGATTNLIATATGLTFTNTTNMANSGFSWFCIE